MEEGTEVPQVRSAEELPLTLEAFTGRVRTTNLQGCSPSLPEAPYDDAHMALSEDPQACDFGPPFEEERLDPHGAERRLAPGSLRLRAQRVAEDLHIGHRVQQVQADAVRRSSRQAPPVPAYPPASYLHTPELPPARYAPALQPSLGPWRTRPTLRDP